MKRCGNCGTTFCRRCFARTTLAAKQANFSGRDFNQPLCQSARCLLKEDSTITREIEN